MPTLSQSYGATNRHYAALATTMLLASACATSRTVGRRQSALLAPTASSKTTERPENQRVTRDKSLLKTAQGRTLASAIQDAVFDILEPYVGDKALRQGDAKLDDRPWVAPRLGSTFPPQVVARLKHYLGDPQGRRVLGALLTRAERYRTQLEPLLTTEGLPPQLLYVAMAESGFDATAQSPVGAAGLWQFTRSTADAYGLKRDRYVDERLDPVKSTLAAARMLRELFARYGDWKLALAAYNMGPSALDRSLVKYNTNDLWRLAELEAGLPVETVTYVSRILAFEIIGENAAKLGLSPDTSHVDNPVAFETRRSVSLGWVAKAGRCDYAALLQVNPALRRRRTPASAHRLWVPASCARATYFKRHAKRMERTRVSPPQLLAAMGAKAFLLSDAPGTTASARRVPGEREAEKLGKIVPLAAQSRYAKRKDIRLAMLRTSSSVAELGAALGIARAWLLLHNPQLTPAARLQAGQVVRVPAAELQAPLAQSEAQGDYALYALEEADWLNAYESVKLRKRVLHTTKKTTTLKELAKRFGVNAADLARINQRGRRETLQAGTEVIVYKPEAR